ncbi:MAG: hypothetical protein OXB96_01065 [Candidatus Kaiserbacteria bacterium]|nr:hypothetical protein [Candidatus Kaiserbacteria bacterium]
MTIGSLLIVLASTLTPMFGGVFFWLFNIQGRLSKLEGVREEQLVAKKSPMTLTEAGERVLKESGGEVYLKSNKDRLVERFTMIKNAFDIQEKAKDIIRQEMQTDSFEKIKEYLFKEGKSADDIELVMGLRLRDVVLESRGIPVQRIDSDKKDS